MAFRQARIVEAAAAFGAQAVLTSAAHTSGSDRIAECARRLGWDGDSIVVNLQGDEPLMPPTCLDQVARLLESHAEADVASLYWPIDNAEEAADPNAVKVVVGKDGAALYFSRSLIPHPRGAGSLTEALASGCRWLRHIGLYAYRAGALRAFAARYLSGLFYGGCFALSRAWTGPLQHLCLHWWQAGRRP